MYGYLPVYVTNIIGFELLNKYRDLLEGVCMLESHMITES